MTRRKRWCLTGFLFVVLGALSGGAYLYQWWMRPPLLNGTLHVTKARSRQLVTLAASEASAIADVDARLTRLLNLADLQISRDWKSDARATLVSASKTLGSAEAMKLNSHARISGWVSVADLCRAVDDSAAAVTACDRATGAMEALEDPSLRCEYVMGIANQLQYLKGAAAAAKLLDRAGPWTRSIDEVGRRRQAVVSFASALFNLDDFTAGQRMLRQEEDASWRSQTLVQLASADRPEEAFGLAARPIDARYPAVTVPSYYGRPLNYAQVFKNNLRSNTQSEPIRVKNATRSE